MSNPVTNAEIEDVLSSIRRLVSDDARTLARSRPVTQPAEPERLVLTPALRVASEPEAESESDTVPDTDPDTALQPHMDPNPEAMPEEMPEAAENSVEDTVEDTGQETFEVPVDEVDAHDGVHDGAHDGVHEADPQDEAVDDETADEPDVSEDAESADASEPWSDPHATLYEVAAAYEDVDDDDDDDDDDDSMAGANDDPEASDFAPFEHRVDGYGADTGGVDEHDMHLAGHDHDVVEDVAPEEDAPHESEQNLTEAASERAELETSRNVDTSPFKEPGLSDAVEVLSAAIVETDEDWEPDGGWQPDGTETAALELPHVETLDWQDAGPHGRATPAGEATAGAAQDDHAGETGSEPDDDQSDSDLSLGDDLVMDEAMLREIVTDIVREELQGALGERITRNVRKLVRREINRALSVQELE